MWCYAMEHWLHVAQWQHADQRRIQRAARDEEKQLCSDDVWRHLNATFERHCIANWLDEIVAAHQQRGGAAAHERRRKLLLRDASKRGEGRGRHWARVR